MLLCLFYTVFVPFLFLFRFFFSLFTRNEDSCDFQNIRKGVVINSEKDPMGH